MSWNYKIVKIFHRFNILYLNRLILKSNQLRVQKILLKNIYVQAVYKTLQNLELLQ